LFLISESCSDICSPAKKIKITNNPKCFNTEYWAHPFPKKWWSRKWK